MSTQYTSTSASCDTYPIPTITTNCDRRRRRQLYDKKQYKYRICCLQNIPLVARVADNDRSSFPTLYVINPTSLAKPHALQKFNTDLSNFDIDVSIVVETWFKAHHSNNFYKLLIFLIIICLGVTVLVVEVVVLQYMSAVV